MKNNRDFLIDRVIPSIFRGFGIPSLRKDGIPDFSGKEPQIGMIPGFKNDFEHLLSGSKTILR